MHGPTSRHECIGTAPSRMKAKKHGTSTALAYITQRHSGDTAAPFCPVMEQPQYLQSMARLVDRGARSTPNQLSTQPCTVTTASMHPIHASHQIMHHMAPACFVDAYPSSSQHTFKLADEVTSWNISLSRARSCSPLHKAHITGASSPMHAASPRSHVRQTGSSK